MDTVTITLNQDELNALTQLLDVAVKAVGIQGARPALAIMDRLQFAVNQANSMVNQQPVPEVIVNN